MEEIKRQYYTGERPLFGARSLKIYDTIFTDGESPLKESRDIELYNSMFKWKYPLWYTKNIKVRSCTWFEMARAGVWYGENIDISGAAQISHFAMYQFPTPPRLFGTARG